MIAFSNCSPVSLQTSSLYRYLKLLPGRAALTSTQGYQPRGNANLGPSHSYLCARPSGGGPCPRTAQLSGIVPDLAGRIPHPGPRDTDLPAAARGRSSTADPRLWRWSPAAARLAISGEARTPLCVGCSSQTSPHSAGQPDRRHSHRLGRWDARPRGTRCARQGPCEAASVLCQPLSLLLLRPPSFLPSLRAPPCTLAQADSPLQVVCPHP